MNNIPCVDCAISVVLLLVSVSIEINMQPRTVISTTSRICSYRLGRRSSSGIKFSSLSLLVSVANILKGGMLRFPSRKSCGAIFAAHCRATLCHSAHELSCRIYVLALGVQEIQPRGEVIRAPIPSYVRDLAKNTSAEAKAIAPRA